MADDVSPGQTRAPEFDVVRRGYDRAQVDQYLKELADEVAELESSVGVARAEALALGIDDREALANELHKVGDDVSTLLEAARAAAEGLRTRAAADAKKWRSEAEAETSAALASTKEQTQALRAAAWNEGTALLHAAADEANRIRSTAQEDALFMRAEAERDALRLTSDARRDREEALRSGRQEAELVIAEARAESDAVLAAAQKQADLAQERARALEDRRSELLAELEATRASISLLEEEIDSRRQELETPPEPEPELDEDVQHGFDVGSVRIVAPSKARTLRPVDSDELVAEVRALRDLSAERAAAEWEAPETVAVISPPHPVPVPPMAVVAEEPTAELEPVPQPPAEPVQPAQSAQDVQPAPQVASPAVETETPSMSDEIGSLFASLRSADTSAPAPPPPPPPPPAPVEAEVSHEVETPSATIEPDPEPVPSTNPAITDEVDDTNAAMLGARNASLKEIKRELVELQNETLEALRTDEDWVPDDAFMDRFGAPFSVLGEATDKAQAAEAGTAFASDLHDSVLSAIEDARSSGKGSRAVAAAASKVFRTWRSDEAERRLQRVQPR